MAVFPNLQGQQFMNLTTFRKTGVAVPTPVWFAQVDDKLYVTTQVDAGKVKRIRHTPRVMVEPCTASGQSLGESVEARARELAPTDHEAANRALSRKYSWQYAAFGLMGRLRGSKRTYLEVTMP
ncbi:MAG: PPOX class F420-dependent oxidoreductase [Chloroflexota bacterium]|nr:PPOX class F420-dependent oxidoreductase [Chloroflexota bacterium]